MSRDYKLKFDQMKGNNPGASGNPEENIENYAPSEYIRNLCFVWADGKCKFQNYSYLISAEYDPDNSEIMLSFTDCKVKLTGHNLEDLYYALMLHIPRFIVCADERYSELEDKVQPVITSIVLKEI